MVYAESSSGSPITSTSISLATFRRKNDVRGGAEREGGPRVGARVFSLCNGIQESNKTFLGHIVLDENGD